MIAKPPRNQDSFEFRKWLESLVVKVNALESGAGVEHATLDGLDFASSGHTGFEEAGTAAAAITAHETAYDHTLLESAGHSLVADEDIVAGDAVALKTNGHIIKAFNTSNIGSNVVGFSVGAITSGHSGLIYSDNQITVSTWNLTLGSVYFLSDVPGAITKIATNISDRYVMPLGVAISTDTLRIEIGQKILL